MSTDQPIQIDIDSIIKARLPRHYRYIPKFMIRGIANAICQDQLNEMLRVCNGKRDDEFCRGVLDHLDITYAVEGSINTTNRRVIIASNHPLGGLDGMILIDYISRTYGGHIKFIVNDLLMAIEPLSGVFLPINKHGRQSRDAFAAIDRAMESDDPIVIFPAGLCSRKGADGTIADLQWQKSFVNKAITYHRDIIPLYFSGQNSKFFYNFAKLRSKIGLKLNIEMARLPKEVFRARGSNFTLRIGQPIPWTDLKGGAKAQQTADEIRRAVYNLAFGQPSPPITHHAPGAEE
ncbi:MAG: 1-acyl-sn-glycerol-3-phosphate acyltransferase [Bacteroides sp.]|nr:1-acyl-sn-glycerol-3-phosphate acyltransferase [Bacteroides sp.]MCM1414270.1 1-acyl-sn-glycerol-3-phosphate acyltransferase [Bacteroides sp.]MCM1470982.1 1-acyl-sn-glycerol-3-phosphate acyltransferase [Bacteroides sp.]